MRSYMIWELNKQTLKGRVVATANSRKETVQYIQNHEVSNAANRWAITQIDL